MSQTHEHTLDNLEQAFADREIQLSPILKGEAEEWMHKLIQLTEGHVPTNVIHEDGWVKARIPLDSVLVPTSERYKGHVYAEVSEPDLQHWDGEGQVPYLSHLEYFRQTTDSDGEPEVEEIFSIDFVKGAHVVPLHASESGFRRRYPHSALDDKLCFDLIGDLESAHRNLFYLAVGDIALNSNSKAA